MFWVFSFKFEPIASFHPFINTLTAFKHIDEAIDFFPKEKYYYRWSLIFAKSQQLIIVFFTKIRVDFLYNSSCIYVHQKYWVGAILVKL